MKLLPAASAALAFQVASVSASRIPKPDPDGKYTIRASGITAKFIPYSAAITNLFIADRNGTIFTWVKAVEGISGAAVLYTICAVVFTCCLGGISFFAFVAIVSFTRVASRGLAPIQGS